MLQRIMTTVHMLTLARLSAALSTMALASILSGCAVAPTVLKPPTESVRVVSAPVTTKAILEKIQTAHPRWVIQALLQPEGAGTAVHLTVYAKRDVHMVVRGFQEPSGNKRIYPDCNHWFNVTRNFDPACGGGPYLGTANLVFADSMGLGLLFDLFQAGRYPFTYTKATVPDKTATKMVLNELLSEAKAAAASSSAAVQVSER